MFLKLWNRLFSLNLCMENLLVQFFGQHCLFINFNLWMLICWFPLFSLESKVSWWLFLQPRLSSKLWNRLVPSVWVWGIYWCKHFLIRTMVFSSILIFSMLFNEFHWFSIEPKVGSLLFLQLRLFSKLSDLLISSI